MDRLFLIGCMGSGKSTIGILLAKKLEYTFIDMDTYIESRYRQKISEIFAKKGESEFREIEQTILTEIAQLQNVVISTGGGTPCFFDNMDVINRSGMSVYLKMTPKPLANRLQNAKNNRPLLKDKTNEETEIYLTELLEKREPFYNQASIVINNDMLSPTETCKLIINEIGDVFSKKKAPKK